MSVLLILGGDVIQQALAQLSGELITPVAFSFGWVMYAISALLAAVGENKLIPPPDTSCLVINSRSRIVRQNNSWVIGRLVRDLEFWIDPQVREKERQFLQQVEALPAHARSDTGISGDSSLQPHRPAQVALCIAVYRCQPDKNAGVPDRDMLYWSGVMCAVVQLAIASIPWGVWGDWSIFMTTACGIGCAFASGALPQWKAEKWSCRKNSKKTITLTRGNGTRHCIVILGNGVGLDLEDLAGGRGVDIPHTRILTSILALCWLVLLIAVSGLKQNPWFLLAVGLIGMMQNVIVCAAPRKPGAFGVHLEFQEAFVAGKVMRVLEAVEEKYPHVGRSLVDTFFPGGLRPHEEAYWKEAETKAKQLQAEEMTKNEQ